MASVNQAKFLYFKTNAAYESAKSSMATGAIAFDAEGQHIYVNAASGTAKEYYIGDIVNDLSTNSSTKSLSAAQGKILYDLINGTNGLAARMTAVELKNQNQDSSLDALDSSVADHETRIGAIEVLDTKMQAAIVAVAKACAANELEGYDGDNTVDITAGSVNASTVDGSIMDGVTKAKIKVRIKANSGIAQDSNGIYVDGTKVTIPEANVTGLSGRLSTLDSSVSDLESKVGTTSVADQIKAAVDAEASARAAADTAEASARAAADDLKVDKVSGKSLVSDTEITKLGTVEENAEKNIIEVVKVNGTALTVAAADRSVDVTVPVLSVKSGDKLLKLNDDKSLETSIYMDYTKADKKIYLYGINGHESSANAICSIDTTDFTKDGMLQDASLYTEAEEGITTPVPYIKLTFNTDAGLSEIRFSVKSLVDTYVVAEDSKNYLGIDKYTVSAKVEVANGLAGYNHLTLTDSSLNDVSTRFNNYKTSNDAAITAINTKNDNQDTSIKQVTEDVATLNGDATTTGSVKKQIYDASTATESTLKGDKTTDTSLSETIVGAKKYADSVAAAVGVSVSITGDDYISNTIASSGKTISGAITASDALKQAIANANTALQTVKVNGTEISKDSSAVNILIGEGTNNGTIAVNNVNVAVHGLASAAYVTVQTLEGTMDTKDVAVKNDLIGASTDASTASTIYGAKNYAKEYTDAATAWYVEA